MGWFNHQLDIQFWNCTGLYDPRLLNTKADEVWLDPKNIPFKHQTSKHVGLGGPWSVYPDLFKPYSNCSTRLPKVTDLTTYWHFGWRVARGVFRFILAFLRSLDICFTVSLGRLQLEVGGQQLEVGGQQLEVGSKQLEVGSKQLEVGSKITLLLLNSIYFLMCFVFGCGFNMLILSRKTGIWLDVSFAVASTKRECSQREWCMVLSKRYGNGTWIALWFCANCIVTLRGDCSNHSDI